MFSRIFTLIKGFINRYIFSIEMDNPDVIYDAAIERFKEAELELRGRAAAVIRQARELADRLKEKTAALKRISELLQQAALLPEDQVDEAAAADMINTQEALTQEVAGLEEDLKAAQTDEKDVREALLEIQAERRKLILEKDRELGRLNSANARIAIHERQDGVSTDEVLKSLAGVRDQIKNRVVEANLAKDMAGTSLENKVKQFEKVTAASSAKQKFAAMRQQAQAKTNAAKQL